MNITFLRHALTEYNKKGLLQGQIDCDLSEEGREELKKFAETFYNQYTVCYCSPLKRTKETAEAVLHGKTPIIYDDRIQERHLGILQDTLMTLEKQKQILDRVNIPQGAESYEELKKRIVNFLDMLQNTYDDNASILVVTHMGVFHEAKPMFGLTDENKSKNLEICIVQLPSKVKKRVRADV